MKNYTDVITCYHMLTDTQHTSIRTHAHSHAHAQADAQTCAPACTPTPQRTYTHARTHARTHAHTRITFGGISCRLVTAAEKGTYRWLYDMYKEQNISTFNYTQWGVGNQSMRDVYLQHAHRKEDMIAS